MAAASTVVAPRPDQIGSPTTGTISAQVVHRVISSGLPDSATAIPDTASRPRVIHMKNTERPATWIDSGPQSRSSAGLVRSKSIMPTLRR